MKNHKAPTEAERLEKYFHKLEELIPLPPKGWELDAKECKYLKILKERNKLIDGAG